MDMRGKHRYGKAAGQQDERPTAELVNEGQPNRGAVGGSPLLSVSCLGALPQPTLQMATAEPA